MDWQSLSRDPADAANTLRPCSTPLFLHAVRMEGERLSLEATGTADGGHCPDCGAFSRQVHGRYRRRPRDLPWRECPARLALTVRRFRCPNGRSFIVAQHQRALEWLATLPFVDAARIGLYGLSYGGKTAMRVPAFLDGRDGSPGYCLSICSGDFNEWLVKIASTDLPMSYLFTLEYEMLEFDLGNTFNYAEMAYLIAPRPFMVERGHRDGVGLDEWVALEYAKVRQGTPRYASATHIYRSRSARRSPSSRAATLSRGRPRSPFSTASCAGALPASMPARRQ